MGQSIRDRSANSTQQSWIALVLRRSGLQLTWDEQNVIARCIVDSIKAALKRGEEVDLPIGTFRVVETPQREHRRWRFGQPQTVFKQRYRVVFEPREEIDGRS